MKDGIYVEIFAVKNGVRYNVNIISIEELSTILAGSLMDGVKKLMCYEDAVKETGVKTECNHDWKYVSTTISHKDMCTVEEYKCNLCGEIRTETGKRIP